MTPDGGCSSDCAAGTSYVLYDGYLYADGVAVSTIAGIPFTQLGGGAAGPINTTFANANGVLSWSNPAFPYGEAEYCVMDSGTIYAIFDYNNPPEDCTSVTLSFFDSELGVMYEIWI